MHDCPHCSSLDVTEDRYSDALHCNNCGHTWEPETLAIDPLSDDPDNGMVLADEFENYKPLKF